MNRTGRRIKPIARPTAFDYNVVLDVAHVQNMQNTRSVSDPTKFRVNEGEVLVRKKKNNIYNDKRLHCFSALNGMETKEREDLEYVGVSVTGHDTTTHHSAGRITSNDAALQGFVATVGGLFTLVNNGKHNILAGEEVFACIPDKNNGYSNRTTGNPHGKELVIVAGPSGKGKGTFVSSSRIGKALSGAKPGETFDVCLGGKTDTHAYEDA